MRAAGRSGGIGVLLVLTLAAVVPSAASSSGAPCAALTDVPTVGPACPVEGGYLIPVGDRWVFTHGGDPMPSEEQDGLVDARPRRPSCADPSAEFHARVIYAHAHDRRDRYALKHQEVRTMVERVNGFIRSEAKRFGRTIEYRTACKRGEVWVQNVVLPTDWDDTTFGTVVNDLVAKGFDDVLAKYWIWFDGSPPKVLAAGTGSWIPDTRRGPDNISNRGPSWAVTWGVQGTAGASVMMHENAHNMGAVSLSSPQNSGAGHCTDGLDIMCYADGGARASAYSTTRCRVARFDCGFDDYFNPTPKKGSYLAQNWNLGSAANRFLAGCTYGSGVLTVAAGGQDPEELAGSAGLEGPGVAGAEHRIRKACRGRSFAASGFLEPSPILFQNTPEGTQEFLYGFVFPFLPDQAWQPDVDVCWYRGEALIRCDDAIGADMGTVPGKATRARVLLKAGAPALYVLNIV